jgi:hypothetical protein
MDDRSELKQLREKKNEREQAKVQKKIEGGAKGKKPVSSLGPKEPSAKSKAKSATKSAAET